MRSVLLKSTSRIILASSSPRRKMLLNGLLKNFGLKFIVKPANITEYIETKITSYPSFVKSLAFKKAKEVSKRFSGVILGADTIVVKNSKVFGKPRDFKHAKSMLSSLSNHWHRVYTGICILDTSKGLKYLNYEVTSVKFRSLSKKEINFYVDSGSPLDKAGSYGIQDDIGCTFVERINGDYFNIVGLPLMKTYLGLREILNCKR